MPWLASQGTTGAGRAASCAASHGTAILRRSKHVVFGVLLLCLIWTSLPLVLSPRASVDGAGPPDSQLELEEQGPSVHSIAMGLGGPITASIVVAHLSGDGTERALVGTSDGFYVVAGDAPANYFYTRGAVTDILVLDDLTGDGMNEVVISTEDNFSPTLRCYDIASGQEVWTSWTMQDVFVEDVGWSSLQLFVTDVVVTEDINGDGIRDISAASEGNAYLLDGRTGKQLWTLETRDHLYQVIVASDDNGDGIGDLAIRAGSGVVYGVSGKDGRLLWRRTAGGDIAGEAHNYSFSDVVSVHTKEGDRLLVSSREGGIRLIDGASDLHDREVSSKPGPWSEVRLLEAADVTGDGYAEVLAYYESAARKQALVLLDVEAADAVWQAELPDDAAGPPALAELDGDRTLLIPRWTIGPEIMVDLISMDNGAVIDSIPLAYFGDVGGSRMGLLRLSEFDSASFLVASDYGDLVRVTLQGETAWRFPRLGRTEVYEGDFNGDSVPDLLVSAAQQVGLTLGSKAISAIDGSSYGVMWRYQVPYNEMLQEGGLKEVKVVPDLDLDGYQDVLALHGSRVRAFSGSSGESLLDMQTTEQPIGVDALRIGSSRLALALSFRSRLFIMDVSGAQVWTATYDELGAGADVDGAAAMMLDDINGDAVDDMVAFAGRAVLALESVAGSHNVLDFSKRTLLDLDDDTEIVSADLSDLDDDGIRDLILVTCDAHTTPNGRLVAISPLSGQLLMQIDFDGSAYMVPASADFDGDGHLDSILFVSGLGPSPQGASGANQGTGSELRIVSGYDSRELWGLHFERYYNGDGPPMASVGDVNSDGRPDVALSVRSHGSGTEMVAVYNGPDGALLKLVPAIGTLWTRQPADPGSLDRLTPSRALHVVGDYTNDGAPEVAVMQRALHHVLKYDEHWRLLGSDAETPIANTSEWHPVIVDLAKSETVSRFLIPADDFTDIGPGTRLAATGSGGKVYLIRPQNTLRVTSPAEGGTTSSPVRVAWGGASADFSLIAVDDIVNRVTHDGQTELPVGGGQHVVRLYSLDRYGRVLEASVSITVRRQFWTVAATSFSIGLLLLVVFLPRMRALLAGMSWRTPR